MDTDRWDVALKALELSYPTNNGTLSHVVLVKVFESLCLIALG